MAEKGVLWLGERGEGGGGREAGFSTHVIQHLSDLLIIPMYIHSMIRIVQTSMQIRKSWCSGLWAASDAMESTYTASPS